MNSTAKSSQSQPVENVQQNAAIEQRQPDAAPVSDQPTPQLRPTQQVRKSKRKAKTRSLVGILQETFTNKRQKEVPDEQAKTPANGGANIVPETTLGPTRQHIQQTPGGEEQEVEVNQSQTISREKQKAIIEDLPEELTSGLNDEEKRIFGQVFTTLQQAAPAQCVRFLPEHLVQLFLHAGMLVQSPQRMVVDQFKDVDKFPSVGQTDLSVHEFVFSESKSIEQLISYCKNVASQKANVDRFPPVAESELATKYNEFVNRDGNPFTKPAKLDKEFSRFDVAQVCNEFQRLGKFNLGKQVEYGNTYIMLSHQFDVALQLLNVMHTATISAPVCRTLALITQSVLQQIYDGYVRLNEIQLLTSSDVYTRELAKSQLQYKKSPLDLPENLAKIPAQAAEARLKRTKERLSNTYTSSYRGRGNHHRGRYNNYNYYGRQNHQQNPYVYQQNPFFTGNTGGQFQGNQQQRINSGQSSHFPHQQPYNKHK